ncbi:MAG: extradiol ring-cleavage dioxygenase [Nitrososphaerota archaeon]|nr:extradiol ring-cleavage dioxygenase [Nitrososphaerota archaeon]MDG6937843.1 extradiol ring-cleavage dioxygenase [Nitrososphaerota archaeon]MDG6952841.1 extradiol ring-cleavage dioxygenase [Nitrososphaerota archaeon]MDG6955985.1 extradiol ring-cleavage dioxygenase [Nitrososphaerota archaeon]MDG6957232.1 extradiol ring-cleavage dioxygenase [Nitrososphaerota archaeon]
MPLVYACIAPHGGETVPALAGRKLRLFRPTRDGMKSLASRMERSKPDTIVIASPHNLRLHRHVGVVTAENSSGSVTEGRKTIRLRAKCDVAFARTLVEEAERAGLPVAGATYGVSEGPLSDLAMDWGTLIPLWFFLRGTGLKSKIVIVAPSRGLPLRLNFEFGRVMARAAEAGSKRVAFVASADQAHAHRRSGPYGYSPSAARYDEFVVAAVNGGRLSSILDLEPGFIDEAKPDSPWQMSMLAGALSEVPMKGEVISYQAPTYYGMLCASYSRKS